MSFVNKEDTEAVEALVENITIDGATLTHTGLSTSDLEHLSKLSHDLTIEMEHQEEELTTIESEDMQEVIVQAQDMEVEIDKVAEAKSKASVPPLRPLTIAPKPTKIPISFKPVAGQPLLLLQGGTSGQQLKLVSPGQGISLSNLTLAKPLSIKTCATKTNNTVPVVQHKQIVMKKVMTQVPKSAIGKVIEGKSGQPIVVVQKSEPQQVKLLQTSTGGTITTTTSKTLTLAQAQQMGILSGSKLVPAGNTKQIILNKNQSKAIKIVPQVRSPTKILPAPQSQLQSGKVSQKIFLKPANVSSANTVLSSQLIQVSGNQSINPGQLHQINIPGKGLQYIKFIATTQADGNVTNVATIQTSKAAIGTKIVPVSSTTSLKGNVILSELKTIGKHQTITSKTIKTPISTVRPVNLNITSNTSGSQVVVLPAGYMTKQAQSTKVAIPSMRHSTSTVKTVQTTASTGDAVVPNVPSATTPHAPELSLESNGMRPRKPCNCTKSQCLKLYCDCFANGEFCYMCNCLNCYNNLENEEHRQRAIKNCLERNPNAFRPKIGKAKDTGDAAVRKHTKGCNCKRSGCLKNYCECYEAKIACSSNCKCMGCRNIEDSMDKKSTRSSALSDSSYSTSPQASRKNSFTDSQFSVRTKRATNNKQAFNYITNAVIEATSQCLLSLSTNAEESGQDEELTKRQLMEEFGRCLKQIIDCSINRSPQKVN